MDSARKLYLGGGGPGARSPPRSPGDRPFGAGNPYERPLSLRQARRPNFEERLQERLHDQFIRESNHSLKTVLRLRKLNAAGKHQTVLGLAKQLLTHLNAIEVAGKGYYYVDALLEMAAAYEGLGQRKPATAKYERALLLAGKVKEEDGIYELGARKATVSLAHLYQAQGRFEAAKEMWERCLGFVGEEAALEVRVNLAAAALELGDFLLAEDVADEVTGLAAAANPYTAVRAHYLKGRALAAQGDDPGAAEALGRCVALAEECGEADALFRAYTELAACQLRLGSAAEGERALEQATGWRDAGGAGGR